MALKPTKNILYWRPTKSSALMERSQFFRKLIHVLPIKQVQNYSPISTRYPSTVKLIKFQFLSWFCYHFMFVYCQCQPPGLLLNVDTGQSIKKRWPWSSRYRTGHETNKLILENNMLRNLLKNSLGKQIMKRLFRTVSCILLLRMCSVYSGQKLKIGIREMQHFYSSNADN